jgi:hypothetical protein
VRDLKAQQVADLKVRVRSDRQEAMLVGQLFDANVWRSLGGRVGALTEPMA